MNFFASTPTCNTTQGTQPQTGFLPNRAALFLKELHSLFGTLARGFSFGLFAPVGAYSTKEVTIE